MPDAEHELMERAWALTRQGARERNLGRRDEALKHYGDAVAIYRAAHKVQRLAHSIRHLADIHREMHSAGLAESCYAEALALYRGDAETPPGDLANLLRGFALLKSETGDCEQARRLWIEARELYVEVNVPAGIQECSEQLGSLPA